MCIRDRYRSGRTCVRGDQKTNTEGRSGGCARSQKSFAHSSLLGCFVIWVRRNKSEIGYLRHSWNRSIVSGFSRDGHRARLTENRLRAEFHRLEQLWRNHRLSNGHVGEQYTFRRITHRSPGKPIRHEVMACHQGAAKRRLTMVYFTWIVTSRVQARVNTSPGRE